MATSVRTGLPSSWVRYWVLAALCTATAIAYIDRGCIQMAVDPIRQELGLDVEKMGLVMSAFFFAYAVFQLPTAWLGHAWGTRWALPFFAVVWSAAIGLSGTAAGFASLVIWRCVMGAAEAGIFPCAMASLGRWFPESRRAWVSGVLGCFMGVGGSLGTALTAFLLAHLTWREVFVVYALPGVVWAVWFLFWFREHPADHPKVSRAELDLIEGSKPQAVPKATGMAVDCAANASIREGEPPAHPARQEPYPPGSSMDIEFVSKKTPWGAIISSSTMWWLGLQQFFRASGFVFFMSWFPYYLQQTRGISSEQAGELASLPHIGLLLGSLAGGVIVDAIFVWTGSRKVSRQGVAVASLSLCGVLTLISGAIADPVLAVVVITLGAFCSGPAGTAAYAMTIDLGGRHVGPVFSVMNMAGNVGAILFPAVAPRLANYLGDWEVVLYAFVAMVLFAAVCWLFMNPNRSILPEPASRAVP